MTDEELAAIEERQRWRWTFFDFPRDAAEEIDALLAEVRRLRRINDHAVKAVEHVIRMLRDGNATLGIRGKIMLRDAINLANDEKSSLVDQG